MYELLCDFEINYNNNKNTAKHKNRYFMIPAEIIAC